MRDVNRRKRALRVLISCLFVLAGMLLLCVMCTFESVELPAHSSAQNLVEVKHPANKLIWVKVEETASGPLSYAITTDGGLSWKGQELRLPPGCDAAFEPSVAIGPKGKIHIAFVAHKDPLSNAGRSGIYVLRSTDSGNTWSLRHLHYDSINSIAFSPRIITDTAGSASTNHVYVAWVAAETSAAGRAATHVMFARSITWGHTYFLPASYLSQGDKLRYELSLSATDSGEVTVGWLETKVKTSGGLERQRVIRRSADRGRNFSIPELMPVK